MHSAQVIDYVVVGAYFLLMIGVGVYVMRYMRGVGDYFAGANRIPWWIAGVSLYMQNFSAWTFSGAAGFTYSTGWFAVLYFATWSLGYLVGARLTASQWRRSRVLSPVEYTRVRFTPLTQQVAGWALAVNFTLTAGVQLAATCKLLFPILQVEIITLILITGGVILLYTYLGGIWAVSITDMAQFAILLSITLLVVPLALGLIGGLPTLLSSLPPLTMVHEYNHFHYDIHWLFSFWIILTVGTAQGAAQRFYSVRDEKSARRVGYLCAGLFITAPLLFAVPPLVARVLWPDLSAEPFFAQFKNLQQPQDLVYAAICMRVLPNGLIGMFAAAMLAATMSTLSGVFNMISAIFTRDVYKSFVRPLATDAQMLRFGKIVSAIIGAVVMGEAVYFVSSAMGIFNVMQQFFSLFNVPLSLPLACGLIFRKVSRWSALAAMVIGLAVSAHAKYVMEWSIGPQVYLTTAVTLLVFLSSQRAGKWYVQQRLRLVATVIAASVFYGAFWLVFLDAQIYIDGFVLLNCFGTPLVLGAMYFYFARQCALDELRDHSSVTTFLKLLDTPVDVAREVTARGVKERSSASVVGAILLIISIGVVSMLLAPSTWNDWSLFVMLASITSIIGGSMMYFGRKSSLLIGNSGP